jgi:hypothetical protein
MMRRSAPLGAACAKTIWVPSGDQSGVKEWLALVSWVIWVRSLPSASMA